MRANGFAIRRLLCIAVFTLAVCFGTSADAAITSPGDNSANVTTTGADPIIGISDVGRLKIDGGSGLTSDDAIVGDLFLGYGIVTVTDSTAGGNISTWATKSLIVGDEGTGRIEILNGGLVSVDFAGAPGTGDFIIGNAVDGVGTVIVSGLGSMMKLGDDSFIGKDGSGTLRIADEGFVHATNSAPNDTDIFTIGLRGRLELANGRLRTQNFVNNGAIVGSGRLENAVTTINNSPTGHIDVGTGDRLTINAAVDNNGAIAIDSGEIEFLKAFKNLANGAELTLRDQGIARFLQTGFGYDSTFGVLATTAGTNDVYGTVRIQSASSKILAAGGSTLVFHDPVLNSGGTIEVTAGSSIVYLQGLTTSGSASMTVSLADPETTPSGAVEVSGDVSIAGSLNVNLASGFKPSAGDSFAILSASGALTGSLNLGTAPTLPGGMQWNLAKSTSDISLSVVATGDFNGNGTVDAGDYVVWRNSLNQQGAGLAADSNGDGVVNATDYSFWRSRVGNVVGGAGSGAAVPETSCIALLAIASAFAGAMRRRRA
jgi:T5SS/PEP-CTERM-associated repeat protein